MPGYNGTGPRGEGPLTGGGRGYCRDASGSLRSENDGANWGVGRGGRPRGGGNGRCWGGGQGYRGGGGWQGRGFGPGRFADWNGPVGPAVEPNREAELLGEIEQLRARIEEFEAERND